MTETITKEYFEQTLTEKLSNYPTKAYFEDYRKTVLGEVREENRRSVGALKEYWDEKLKLLHEGDKTYEDKSERYEKENTADHEQFNRRLLKLELKRAK